MNCPRCKQPTRIVFYTKDGDSRCSNCKSEEDASNASIAIQTDDIPGGMWLENYGPHPIKVYSHTEREAIMRSQGLQLKEKFCPTPGTDKDPSGVMNPKGYMDPYTLAAGAALIARNGQKAPDFDGVESGVLRNFTDGHLTERDAIAIASGDARRQSRLHRRMN